MPGSVKHSAAPSRYIKSDLKSHKLVWEEEHPIRWSYMKILREFSTLKQFYPQINPYAEVYQMRENMWAIYSESMDGVGDPWMYLIDGPEKALVIDTAFGVGDLKGLAKKIVKDKPIIAANTHHHYDHAYGNAQFDLVYCHEDELFALKQTMNPHIWDYLFGEDGKPLYTEFDRADLIEYKDYELVGLKSNQTIDLGGGYLIELIPLRGHTAGQCGYLDKQSHAFFCGDITGIGAPKENEPKPENCTVERLCLDMQAIVERLDEIGGVFPGHGMLDQTPIMLQYELDSLQAILKNPENYDSKKVFHRPSGEIVSYTKNIYQGTAVRYNPEFVYIDQVKSRHNHS